MTEADDRWEGFLTPEVVRGRLLSASMYITAYELLKDSIVDRIRDYYSNTLDESRLHPSPEYQNEVLARNRSPVYASLDWLKEHEAITDEEIEIFERLKGARNALAHSLHSVVIGGEASTHVQRFPELVALLRKIEVWWIVNVEVPTNPDYDGRKIDESGIVPGPVLSLQILIEVAGGSTEFLSHYRNASKVRRDV